MLPLLFSQTLLANKTKMLTMTLRGSVSAPSSANKLEVSQVYWRTPPLRRCGKRTVLLVASQLGPNQGHEFFACKSVGGLRHSLGSARWGCGYFKWSEESDKPVLALKSPNIPIQDMTNN